MSPDLGWDVLSLLGLAAFASGFVDAISGGGGMITMPALLLAGLDPVSAVATNKLQGVFGTGSSMVAYARARMIDWPRLRVMMLGSAIAGMSGAFAVKNLPDTVLKALVPLLLLSVAIYFAFSPALKDEDAQQRMRPAMFGVVLVMPVAFYDGFFGPGAGSFYMLGGVALLGFGVLRAAAQTKALNFASNLASLSFFIVQGLVVWHAGLVMGAAAWVGAQVGSKLAIRHGVRLIKPMLVVMCLAIAIKLMLDPANPLRALILP
jgi:uncharacterized membrane protein YfcA